MSSSNLSWKLWPGYSQRKSTMATRSNQRSKNCKTSQWRSSIRTYASSGLERDVSKSKSFKNENLKSLSTTNNTKDTYAPALKSTIFSKTSGHLRLKVSAQSSKLTKKSMRSSKRCCRAAKISRSSKEWAVGKKMQTKYSKTSARSSTTNFLTLESSN